MVGFFFSLLYNICMKNILLGVTGSISIYKSVELVRMLVKANYSVKVIMTKCATEFIKPLLFEIGRAHV